MHDAAEPCWTLVEHDADIGIRAEADSRAALFEAFGQALTAIVTEPSLVEARSAVQITCEAPDDALLLTDWLNALIYEMSTGRVLFSAWDVSLEDHRLRATVRGEPVDRQRHRPAVEIKGATYTALSVGQDATGRWHGQCVVDV